MNNLTPESKVLIQIPNDMMGKFPNVNLVDVHLLKTKVPAKTIFISDELQPKEAIECMISNAGSSLIQINEGSFIKDLEALANIVENPKIYFETLGTAVLTQPIKSKIFEFKSTQDKDQLMKDCQIFVSQIQSNSLTETTISIIEELYMNAILDAPRESLQKNKADHPYALGKSAKMNLVYSEDQLAIACTDPYGSLNPARLLERLNEVYHLGPGNCMQMEAGKGAGIGCMLMFEKCASMYVGVVKDKLTTVTLVLPTKMSSRKRSDLKKSIHLFQLSKFEMP